MSDPHPKYLSPAIVEATCEIAFVTASDERLSSRALYDIVGGEFPEMQPVAGMNLQILIQAGVTVQQPPAEQMTQANVAAFRFGAAANDRFVQVSKTNFVYQIVGASYAGWDDFKAKSMELWSQLLPLLKPEQIVKIGMRYVNRIAKTQRHPYLGDWLRESVDLPKALIDSQAHFLARIESTPSVDSLKLVTLANQVADQNLPHGAIVLDIDCISTESHVPSADAILGKLEFLHESIWAVFSSAKTDVLEEKLKGN